MRFNLSNIGQQAESAPDTLYFCDDFLNSTSIPKFILGRNIYSECVARQVSVSGFVDDFASDTCYLGLPVVKTGNVPKNALVLNASGGRPLSARLRLNSAGLRNLDYFAFYKASGLSLLPMRFNEGFENEFSENIAKYEWIYGLLKDDLSKDVFRKLVSFRYNYNISHLEGFTQREDVQYFEDFLALNPVGETFIDVGCYDGYTSREFIKRCPHYNSIHVFEPDAQNMLNCNENLRDFPNVHCYPIGLSNNKGLLKFDVSGSASRLSDTGSISVLVDRLDDVLSDTPTFLKMDIEGGESAAIEGAHRSIQDSHSRLAISVYHKPGDFWRIPEQILNIRDDYDILMRHYTECIYETVMFFLPRK